MACATRLTHVTNEAETGDQRQETGDGRWGTGAARRVMGCRFCAIRAEQATADRSSVTTAGLPIPCDPCRKGARQTRDSMTLTDCKFRAESVSFGSERD